MMKSRLVGLLVACVYLGVAHAQVNALPSQPHLLVKGEASRVVVPDRFKVGITLDATDLNPETARATVQANLAGVLRALKSSHALADSIDATTFSVGPEYRYENNKQVFLGTKASRRIEGTFASADDTRAFLSRMQAGEHVLLSGIETSISSEAAIRGQLKEEAMRQTRRQRISWQKLTERGLQGSTVFRMSRRALPMASRPGSGRVRHEVPRRPWCSTILRLWIQSQ